MLEGSLYSVVTVALDVGVVCVVADVRMLDLMVQYKTICG
jgi:hypothetical protein